MEQRDLHDSLEEPALGPLREATMTRRSRAEQRWQRLPLAAGPEFVQDAGEDHPVGHTWPPTQGFGPFDGEEVGDEIPKCFRDLRKVLAHTTSLRRAISPARGVETGSKLACGSTGAPRKLERYEGTQPCNESVVGAHIGRVVPLCRAALKLTRTHAASIIARCASRRCSSLPWASLPALLQTRHPQRVPGKSRCSASRSASANTSPTRQSSAARMASPARPVPASA